MLNRPKENEIASSARSLTYEAAKRLKPPTARNCRVRMKEVSAAELSPFLTRACCFQFLLKNASMRPGFGFWGVKVLGDCCFGG